MREKARLSAASFSLAAVLVAGLLGAAGPATAEATTLTFTPVADTYVASGTPGMSFGSALTVNVDGSPIKRSFLRFDLQGIGDQEVASVKLQMFQTDASGAGGRVWSMTDDTWTEDTTYDTQPTIDGPQLATFGTVSAGNLYEVDLGAAVAADGSLSLAIDSPSTNGADWASSESANPPLLSIEFEEPPAGLETAHSFSFVPSADTYVQEAAPNASNGSSTSLYADSSSAKQAFLRFNVHGLGDRLITEARLVLTQRGSSVRGGRFWAISDDSWSEATTWATKPSIDGSNLGSIGAVLPETQYELDVSSHVTGDGVYSFAIDSDHSDDSQWYSSNSNFAPKLVVGLAAPVEGLTQVADGATGSSDPTYYASNHRLSSTEGGRSLAIHGLHKEGVRLAWMDPGSGWRSDSRGSVSNGRLLSGTGTGDWSASITAAGDKAWTVIGGPGAGSTAPLRFRRITELEDSAGPRIGPLTSVPLGTSLGTFRPDLGIETSSTGSKVLLTWTRRTPLGSYQLMAGWITNLADDSPAIVSETVLATSSSSGTGGTVIPTSDGAAIAARANGALKVYRHASTDPLTTWSKSTGASLSSHATPSGVALSGGSLLVTAESSSGVVKVQRFTRGGVSTDLELTGYTEPTLASDGTRAWLVMIRKSDGHVVSRSYGPSSGWLSSDSTEVGAEGGGSHRWPNAYVAGGSLHVLFRGPTFGYRSEVMVHQRALD